MNLNPESPLLYRNSAYQILRLHDPVAGTVIVKRCNTSLGVNDSAWQALQNEQRILARLQGVTGCPQLIRLDLASMELVLADFGGVVLSDSGLLGQVGLEGFLTLAEQLAQILADLHQCGVIHKDINPTNILVRPDDLSVQLIDFGSATTFAAEQVSLDTSNFQAASPAYMSPEQTRRMNRTVDYRTDLYSLGATLYALATGTPPFAGDDVLALVRAHLAEPPTSPSKQSPWMPAQLAEMILCLLAKDPDARYQSAAGLLHDLRGIGAAVAVGSSLSTIELRRHDLPLSPRSPCRLYGRAQECAHLQEAFDGARRCIRQGIFVAGYSGVGKSALIHELHRPVALVDGLFLEGKFEQFLSDRPFHAPAQALRQLTQWLSGCSEDKQEQLRQQLLDALGPDAGVLCEAVPELENFIGVQPIAQALGLIEAQRRLRRLLVAFLRTLASVNQPIVLFLDDLQWADQPSLDFIAALLEDVQLDGFLFIGAYRDNEVDTTHPLHQLLQVQLAQGLASQLRLEPLDSDNIGALLADMLGQAPTEVAALVEGIFAKTGGNPFFSIELVQTLYREGILRPDTEAGRWLCDDAALAARQVSCNVVDFLMANLAGAQQVVSDELVIAACLGTSCSLAMLALASGSELPELVARLQPALEYGIIESPDVLAFERMAPDAKLHFCHDRMQQAVYQMRDEHWRSRQHLAIARRFADADSFLAAMHYAQAPELVEAKCEATERDRIRGLFRDAASQAGQVGAFATAERFLRLAIALLSSQPWSTSFTVCSELHTQYHLILYSLARYDEADAVYRLLAEHNNKPLQLVDAACTQIRSLSNRTRYSEGIAIGATLLGLLDQEPPLAALLPALQEELDYLYRQLAVGTLDRLADAPAVNDMTQSAIAKLQNHMIPVAFFAEPLLACWLSVRLARRWLNEGYSDQFIYATACTILATIPLRNDYASGYRVARHALEIGLQRDGGVETARTEHVFALFNCHWFEPLSEALDHARSAFNKLIRAGEFEFASYTFFTSQAAMLGTCNHLAQFKNEIAAAFEITRKTGNLHAEQAFVAFRQLARALEGETVGPGSFETEDCSEYKHLEVIAHNPMARCYFHAYRALSALLFNDREALIFHADAAATLTPYIVGFYPTALVNFLHSFSLLEKLNDAPDAMRETLLLHVGQNQIWLGARAADSPMNFAYLHDLIEAYRFDRLGQPWSALQSFEQAMRWSTEQRHGWQLALIMEHAGTCYLRHGLESCGRHLLNKALKRYQLWGASGKTNAMLAAYPFLDLVRHHGTTTRSVNSDTIDLEALLRASQALASEISLTSLTDRLVTLIGQLTGATDVRFLLLDDAEGWSLEGGLRDQQPLERMSLAMAVERQLLPARSWHLFQKIREPLISEDAVSDSRFIGDLYFTDLQYCSLLALPILTHGTVTAILSLENRLCRAAFTPQRIEMVTLLCSQLSISIENSRLYESLERKVNQRTKELAEVNAQLLALSECDGLTGIANRRKFDMVWADELRRSARQQLPVAVIMIDIDYFKGYNDHYGHQEGDACLRQVAQTLATTLQRGNDLVARYGGEEFVVVMPGLTDAQAATVADRLRQAVEASAIPHAKSSAGPVVTISAGVAAGVPHSPADPGEILTVADARLYQAKQSGRNRVVSA